MTSVSHHSRVPSRLWYFVALAIVLAGWGWAGVLAWRLVHTGTDLVLFAAPGEATLALVRPTEYTIYHEFEGVMKDEYYFREIMPAGLSLAVRDADSGTTLPLAIVENPRPTYRFGGRRGAPLARFTVDKPTTVTVIARLPADAKSTFFGLGTKKTEQVWRDYVHLMLVTLGSTMLGGALALMVLLIRLKRARTGESKDVLT